jgi:hypothetical protein
MSGKTQGVYANACQCQSLQSGGCISSWLIVRKRYCPYGRTAGGNTFWCLSALCLSATGRQQIQLVRSDAIPLPCQTQQVVPAFAFTTLTRR